MIALNNCKNEINIMILNNLDHDKVEAAAIYFEHCPGVGPEPKYR